MWLTIAQNSAIRGPTEDLRSEYYSCEDVSVECLELLECHEGIVLGYRTVREAVVVTSVERRIVGPTRTNGDS
jgi:hypothetical protein